MKQPNAGYLFYKKNFSDVPGVLDHSVNALLEGISAFRLPAPSRAKPSNFHSFGLYTTYPGLLIGSGYTHDAKNEEKAYKIGFFFDHTTGLPVIPGSSMKGALRSLFPNRYRWHEAKGEERANWDVYSGQRYEFMRFLIGEICGVEKEGIGNETIDAFESEMFEGVFAGKQQSVYSRDIFLDALPAEIHQPNLGAEKRLFGNDYLTPHLNRKIPELSPFTEPDPLQFLKVMPEVKYEFRFILQDSQAIPEMTSAKKQALVSELILFRGIGAKTNVGYGQFSGQAMVSFETGGSGGESGEATQPPFAPRTEPSNYTGRVKPGAGPLEAKVLDPQRKLVEVRVHDQVLTVQMSGNCPHQPGELVRVVLNQVEKKTGKITLVGYQGPIKR